MTRRSRTLEGPGSEARLRRLAGRFRRASGRIDRHRRRETWLTRGEHFLIWFAGFCIFAAVLLVAIGLRI